MPGDVDAEQQARRGPPRDTALDGLWPLDAVHLGLVRHPAEADVGEVQLHAPVAVVEIDGRGVGGAHGHGRRHPVHGAGLHAEHDVPGTGAARHAEAEVARALVRHVDAGEVVRRAGGAVGPVAGGLREQPQRHVRVAHVRRDADGEPLGRLPAHGGGELGVAEERRHVVPGAEHGVEPAVVGAEPPLREEAEPERELGQPAQAHRLAPVEHEERMVLSVARVAELVLVMQERAQHAEAHVDPAGREQARRVAVARGGHERQGRGVRVDRRGVVKAGGVGPAHPRGRGTVAGQVGGVRREGRLRRRQQARDEAADENHTEGSHDRKCTGRPLVSGRL